eukprot:PhM_4_TR1027/c0_g1_i1/m.75324
MLRRTLRSFYCTPPQPPTLNQKLKQHILVDDVRVRNQGRSLHIKFNNQPKPFVFCAEMLRVMAPSTDVHDTLIYGRRGVAIVDMYAVGNYAFRIIFSDKHDAGIFSYDYLTMLGNNKYPLMKQYILRLRAANRSRVPQLHRIKQRK